VMTAAMIAFVPSVGQPIPPPRPVAKPTVQLVALVQPTNLPATPPILTVLLNSPLALLGPAEPLGTGLPPTPAPLAIPIAPNLADTIDNIYVSVEPWVQYGFEVATAAVRWIPYVGYFAGFIMDGYFFGESIVASAVFNFTDFLRGNGGIVQNLVDFGVDVGLAFVWLGIDAVGTVIPLPPCCYPPRPPVQGPFLAAAGTTFSSPAMKNEPTLTSVEDLLAAPKGSGLIGGLIEKIASGPLLGRFADIAAPGPGLEAVVPDIQTPEPPINRPVGDGSLTKLIQSFTHEDAPGRTTSVNAPRPGLEAVVPDIQTPEPPINRPVGDGRLTKLIQRFTHEDAPGGTTSVNVQSLGAGGNDTQDQPRPRPHKLVRDVSSAVRDLVSSAPHPLRDRLAAAKLKKDNGDNGHNGDNGGATE
jgi:hypothetical protein